MPAGYKLLYQQKFENESARNDFVFTDREAWKISKEPNGLALELTIQSRYQPAVRSPVNVALIADKVFTDFVLEAELLSTAREYGHRDMCLFYGVTSPTRFYYTHLASAADPHAHNIFIVNDAARLAIGKETTRGVAWGTTNQWHKVRLERKVADGAIKVYFDDLTRPIMIAEDKTFPSGCIGFGSFDDTGKVRQVRVWGRSMASKKTDFYSRPKTP